MQNLFEELSKGNDIPFVDAMADDMQWIWMEGKAYNNKYCWVCRIVEGKLRELKEYMDTQLVTETFQGT